MDPFIYMSVRNSLGYILTNILYSTPYLLRTHGFCGVRSTAAPHFSGVAKRASSVSHHQLPSSILSSLLSSTRATCRQT